jgi:hypothetical protein
MFFATGGILEYGFGGTKQIGEISGTASEGTWFCAVDPTTGNLATTWGKTGSEGKGEGWVAVYADISSTPQVYKIPNMGIYYYCGYDNQGNLFVDGLTHYGAVLFAELPKGANAFTAISLSQSVFGYIQWDGTYITIENVQPPIIYRISISGSSGTIVGTTKLRASKKTKNVPYAFTWIDGDTVLSSQGGPKNPNVGFWNYPAGGKPYRVIRGLTSKKNRVDQVVIDMMPSH